MKIKSTQWSELLTEGAAVLGVNVNASHVRDMRLHAVELIKWNKVTNLTSITDPLEIAVKHFLDSAAVIPFIAESAKILDVGSGAGFPGIPLKIISPSFSITMMESSRKKISFLKHVIRTLNINDILAIHARCEHMAHLDTYRESFDVVICRAFTELAKFIKIAIPFLSKGGTIIALKGKLDKDSHSSDGINIGTNFVFSKRLFSIKNHFFQLPIIGSHRNIIFVKQI